MDGDILTREDIDNQYRRLRFELAYPQQQL